MIAEEFECSRLLHDGQFEYRQQRLEVDAVGRFIKRVEEAWIMRNTTAVLLMNVESALPYVTERNLSNRIEVMGFKATLVR